MFRAATIAFAIIAIPAASTAKSDCDPQLLRSIKIDVRRAVPEASAKDLSCHAVTEVFLLTLERRRTAMEHLKKRQQIRKIFRREGLIN